MEPHEVKKLITLLDEYVVVSNMLDQAIGQNQYEHLYVKWKNKRDEIIKYVNELIRFHSRRE